MSTRILIVDDTPSDKEILKEHLMVWGHEMVFASSGEDALRIVNDNKIDLILLDVVLPGIDGFEVCKRLKADDKTKFIPVLMITSLLREYRLLAINLGADEFLSKPIDKVELNVRIKSLLRIKSMHDKLEESYKTLEELVKLKDYLSSTITHDINNHLMVIKNFFDFMASKKTPLPDSIKEGLAIATQASDSLVSLVSDFIDVKKMEESKLMLHLEEADIASIVLAAVEEMTLLAKQTGIKLSKSGGNNPLSCKIDKRLIMRVITNLLVNAIKSTPKGGSIEAMVATDENSVRVSIKDSGVGVPVEYKEKIFDKFVVLENRNAISKPGKGLGLTFCKFAVEAHGGKIWVESEGKDKGSTFVFTIPKEIKVV